MTIPELKARIAELEAELQTIINTISMTGQEIYAQAAANLGKHLTLNDNVPAEEGCAEAVSKVLSLAGISDGAGGIPGTATLYAWLSASPLFERIDAPQEGAIIISPTGMGNGTVEGHTGIIGVFGKQYPGDWGICSNDSASGLFLERWSYKRWLAYYHGTGGLPVVIFKAV